MTFPTKPNLAAIRYYKLLSKPGLDKDRVGKVMDCCFNDICASFIYLLFYCNSLKGTQDSSQ